MSNPAPSPAPAPRRWVLPVALVVVLIAAGVTAYLLWPKPEPVKPQDLDAAIAHNNRGVALMEQMENPFIAKAELEFEKAVELAPDWQTAKLNYAISLFNQQSAEKKELDPKVIKAQSIFREVLAQDPDNKHAHYCLGMIDMHTGKYADAHPHFKKVNEADPNDAHTWLRLGATHPDGQFSPAAGRCYEKAIAFDPYLTEARYGLFIVLRDDDPNRAESLLAEHELLLKADQYTEAGIIYSEMGKYGDVIGRDPKVMKQTDVGPLPMFEPVKTTATLAPGAKWATPADLNPTQKAARERFGGAVVLFDYDGDGKPDVLLLGAVVEGGKVRDLLLHNDGDGKFADVTAAAGLAGERVSFGAAPADYDNDGRPDLLVTTATGVRLFHNTEGGKFADVTTEAKLDGVKGLFLGCGWADIDQDGDLDVVACKYADGDTAAFDKSDPAGGVVVVENVGVAPPADPKGPAPPLSTAFRMSGAFKDVFPGGSMTGLLVSDTDDDRDPDLVLFPDGGEPAVADNHRLMRWRKGQLAGITPPKGRWNGGLVLDANHDGRSDLLLVRAGETPVLLVSKGTREFSPETTDSPVLRQATVADIDLDGWPDVAGQSADGKTVLLHNQADGKFEVKREAFGDAPVGVAVTAADLDGDGRPDLLTWTDAGLDLRRNRGGNHPLIANATGKRDKGTNCRTSNDGLGSWLVAQAGSHWTGAERTTATAGLGQSLLPTVLGLGKHQSAEALRVRWPDLVVQAEIDVAAGTPYKLTETNRKGTSCPVLMAWDGERFVFVTDFLGAGALGESGPDGSVRPPRGEESVKIEPGLLVAKNGEFLLKIAEPMDEVLYLDRLQLVVVDHPAGTAVFPDERFVFSGPQPTQKLLAFPTRLRPTKATDHTGTDVTDRVKTRDRKAVDGFKTRSWLGYAEDHSLALEFGQLPQGGRWNLVLAGWTEYPYPESMYAATRAGVALQPPVLEQYDAKADRWVTVCDLGFPAGLPRVMTRELPAVPAGKLRIRTNMQVFWDEVYLAPAEEVKPVATLDVKRADLAARGFMQEVYPDGRPPVAYDDAKTEPVATTRWMGMLTRLGDVTDLVTRLDDRFVLCGPGDEITARFDATGLPELKPGWKRSFVLRSQGYCKDTSSTTVTGGEVGPLPFRGMPNYPDFGGSKPPATDADRWHTRPTGGR